MEIHNPIYYLLDNYYECKYVLERKTFKYKSINFYISFTYKKTQTNKKFTKLFPVFNSICCRELGRNITSISYNEFDELLRRIDNTATFKERQYHLEEFYEHDPMTPEQFRSLKLYNFYDFLLFEYYSHRDKDLIKRQLEEHSLKKLKCEFK